MKFVAKIISFHLIPRLTRISAQHLLIVKKFNNLKDFDIKMRFLGRICFSTGLDIKSKLGGGILTYLKVEILKNPKGRGSPITGNTLTGFFSMYFVGLM